ncbi:DUF655 domain-containing protein [Sulfurisphaera ohwakuensis]|uniref:DUF655 domain-containing protein n=1 Tax=Sulfurisphaera ohwakuensis TaxID=69656 RepID=A0A650CE48_SULOH|nr:DUF655 domain-containing protein [Sulfurisphaera ohwakuensis]MBB5252962.1 putative nucleotide binding protein [Sulfurisphaera ohwakuensis]QGR16110.1 DUF655 domain-containing protein [Sulfurisphaera ohwakuensis]
MQRRRDVKVRMEKIAYILDYMRQGNPLDKHPQHKNRPVMQLLGEDYFMLMEATPLSSNIDFQIEQKLELENSPIKIDFHITYEDLTSVAKDELPKVIRKIITEDKSSIFVEFFNKAEPLTLKLHALELLPNIGKKTLRIILEERKKQPFVDFKDIETRVGIKDVVGLLIERIIKELQGGEKYYLFVYPLFDEKSKKLGEHSIYIGYLEKLGKYNESGSTFSS